MKSFLALALLFPALASSPEAPATGTPYPNDVRRAFFTSCVGAHRELIPACRCMIKGFEMRHSLAEFEAMTKLENPVQDPRFTTIANHCTAAQ